MKEYEFIDHTYDVVVVGAGGAGLRATLVYESQLGVQVVVEDYVQHHGLKIATMMLLTFAHVAVAALAIFAVLRLAFGAA